MGVKKVRKKKEKSLAITKNSHNFANQMPRWHIISLSSDLQEGFFNYLFSLIIFL